jgi:uncharacterized membrane protein
MSCTRCTRCRSFRSAFSRWWRPDLPDDFYRSHFRWQARSFWFTLLWLALTAPLFLLLWFPGWTAWSVIGLWYLYRFVRGWWNYTESRPMPVPAT